MTRETQLFLLAAMAVTVIGLAVLILVWRGDVHDSLTFAALLSISPLQLLNRTPPTVPAPLPPGTSTATATLTRTETPAP